jgi:NhaP-type Na+/H+ or K+/H+ antiporter
MPPPPSAPAQRTHKNTPPTTACRPHPLIAFSDTTFFSVLLPPIIFWAGFSLKKRAFFANAPAIMLLGLGGTLVSAAVVAAGAGGALTALEMCR